MGAKIGRQASQIADQIERFARRVVNCSAFQPNRVMKSALPPLSAWKRRKTSARA